MFLSASGFSVTTVVEEKNSIDVNPSSAVMNGDLSQSPLMMFCGEEAIKNLHQVDRHELPRASEDLLQAPLEEQNPNREIPKLTLEKGGMAPEEDLDAFSQKPSMSSVFGNRNYLKSAPGLEIPISWQTESFFCNNESMDISVNQGSQSYDLSVSTCYPEEKTSCHQEPGIAQTLPVMKPEVSDKMVRVREEIKKRGTENKVAFALVQEEVKNSSDTASSGIKNQNQKIYRSYLRKLTSLTTGTEIELDDLSEETFDREDREAAIYSAAYPKIAADLQKFLITVKNEAMLQDVKTADALAQGAIKLIEVAFHSVNLEKVQPIKIVNNAGDKLVAEKKIPSMIVSYGSIEPDDFDVTAAIYDAHYIETNLEASLKVLHSPSDQAGSLLQRSKKLRVATDDSVICKKVAALNRKRNMLSGLSVPLSREHTELQLKINQDNEEYKKRRALSAALYEQPLVTDWGEAKKSAIADIIMVAEHALEAGENLKALLECRIIH